MKNSHEVMMAVMLCTLTIAGCASNNGGETYNPLNDSMASAGRAGQSVQAIQSAGQIPGTGMGAASAVTGGQGGIVQLLANQLGISPNQAAGGAGSIFRAASENMSPQEFSTVSQSVPGMDKLLAAAPALPAAGSLGGASSMLGGSSQMGSAAGLASAFQQLNLSPDMVGKFLPIITQSLESSGGSAAAGLLRSALSMP